MNLSKLTHDLLVKTMGYLDSASLLATRQVSLDFNLAVEHTANWDSLLRRQQLVNLMHLTWHGSARLLLLLARDTCPGESVCMCSLFSVDRLADELKEFLEDHEDFTGLQLTPGDSDECVWLLDLVHHLALTNVPCLAIACARQLENLHARVVATVFNGKWCSTAIWCVAAGSAAAAIHLETSTDQTFDLNEHCERVLAWLTECLHGSCHGTHAVNEPALTLRRIIAQGIHDWQQSSRVQPVSRWVYDRIRTDLALALFPMPPTH